jgi:hypothetical protein
MDKGAQLRDQCLTCDRLDGVPFRFQLVLKRGHRCNISRPGKLERPFERGGVWIHNAYANDRQSKKADTAINNMPMWSPGS